MDSILSLGASLHAHCAKYGNEELVMFKADIKEVYHLMWMTQSGRLNKPSPVEQEGTWISATALGTVALTQFFYLLHHLLPGLLNTSSTFQISEYSLTITALSIVQDLLFFTIPTNAISLPNKAGS